MKKPKVESIKAAMPDANDNYLLLCLRLLLLLPKMFAYILWEIVRMTLHVFGTCLRWVSFAVRKPSARIGAGGGGILMIIGKFIASVYGYEGGGLHGLVVWAALTAIFGGLLGSGIVDQFSQPEAQTAGETLGAYIGGFIDKGISRLSSLVLRNQNQGDDASADEGFTYS